MNDRTHPSPIDCEEIALRLPRLTKLDLAGRGERWLLRLAGRLGFRDAAVLQLRRSEAPRVLRSSGTEFSQQLQASALTDLPEGAGSWTTHSVASTGGSWARLLARCGAERLTIICVRDTQRGRRHLLLIHDFELDRSVERALSSAATLLVEQAEVQARLLTQRAESTALRRELRVALQRQLSLEAQTLRWRKLFAHANHLRLSQRDMIEMLGETAATTGEALGLSCLVLLRERERKMWLLGSPELCRSTRGGVLREVFAAEKLGTLEDYRCVGEESSTRLRGLLAAGGQQIHICRARLGDDLLLGVRLGWGGADAEGLEFFERAGLQFLMQLQADEREAEFESRINELSRTVDELLDREAAGRALAKRQLSEQLLASLPTAVMLLSNEGELRYANAAARRLLALRAGEAEGAPQLPEPSASAIQALVEELHESGELSREIQWPGEGVEHLRVELRELRDDGGEALGVLLSLRDISKRKRLQLEQTEFVGSVSHELRTPLTSMRAALELVLQGEAGELSEEQSHFLEMSRRNIDRLARLIERLLDVARHDDGRLLLQREARALDEILEAPLTVFHGRARREARQFRAEIEAGLQAYVDPDRFVEIVENLVGNALKFTEPGGRVELRIAKAGRCLDAKARQLGRAAGHSVEGVELVLRDDGKGMAVDESRRAFDRFYQAGDPLTGRPQGVGLGLAITRALAAAHDGQIQLESAPGQGTTVRVWIPATEADARICATVERIDHGLGEWSRSLTRGRLIALLLPEDAAAGALREELAKAWSGRDLSGNWPSEPAGRLCFALAPEEDWRPAFVNDARRLGVSVGLARYPADGRSPGTLLALALEAVGDVLPARIEQES